MKGKNLINILKNADISYVESQIGDAEYHLALHDLVIQKDYEGASNLISALAGYHKRFDLQSFDYDKCLDYSREEVKDFAIKTDSIFGLGDVLKNFIKESINRNLVSEFLEQNPDKVLDSCNLNGVKYCFEGYIPEL